MTAKESKSPKLLKVIRESDRGKTYGFISFTLLVVLVLLIGAIRPTLLTISRINKEIKQKRTTNELLDSKITTLASLSQQFQEIQPVHQDLQLIFPAQGNFSLFMSNVDAVSEENGFILNAVNFSKGEETNLRISALRTWSTALNVDGKRPDLIRFLEDLEAMPIYGVIDSVAYTNRTDDSGLTTFTIRMTIYHVDDPDFYN